MVVGVLVSVVVGVCDDVSVVVGEVVVVVGEVVAVVVSVVLSMVPPLPQPQHACCAFAPLILSASGGAPNAYPRRATRANGGLRRGNPLRR